jgi:hypothetical protein
MPKTIGTIRNFIGLVDTPSSYAGVGGKGLKVNLATNALEYADFLSPTGLEQVTEDSNTGLRRIGVDPAFYGDIGRGAVDFSTSDAPSSTMGSTGNDSFTIGYLNITAGYAGATFGQVNSNSGDHALVSGDTNIATINAYGGLIIGFSNNIDGVYNRAYGQGNITSGGWSAVADGFENQALENYAYARGFKNIARGYGSYSMGLFCDVNSIRTSFAFGDSCVTTADGSFLSGIALSAGDSFGVMVTGTANVTFTGSGAGDRYNPIDPIFVVGNGTYNTPGGAAWTGNVRSNALFLDKGGRLFLPSVNDAMIDGATNDIVPTKGWINAEIAASSGGPLIKGTVDCGTMGADTGARPVTGNITTAAKNAGTDFHYITVSFNALANTNYMVQVSLECATAANRLWHPTIFSKATTNTVIAIGQDPTVNAENIIASIVIISLD